MALSISLVLAGCSSPAADLASKVTAPVGFHEVSKSEGSFEFSTLNGDKNEADLTQVCQNLFTWATANNFTRYSLIDNFFQLADYDNQGRLISNMPGDDAPFIAACGNNMASLTEKGPHASPEGVNHNRIIVFFGKFGENKDTIGDAYITVGFKNKVKYLTLNGEFKTSPKPTPTK
jgi:hypothetical protein